MWSLNLREIMFLILKLCVYYRLCCDCYVITRISIIIIILYVGNIQNYGLLLYIEFVGVTSKFSSVARFLRACKQRNR